MKLLLKILFFLLTIFQTNICEAKVFLFGEAVSQIRFIEYAIENKNEVTTNSESDIAITCESESDLLDYRNLVSLFKANATMGIVNQTSKAILKNGYYEVNGFKFSEYYCNKLWSTGWGAPSHIANEVLQGGAKTAVPDALKEGFYKYIHGGWEMIYNPATKEVLHLQPIR